MIFQQIHYEVFIIEFFALKEHNFNWFVPNKSTLKTNAFLPCNLFMDILYATV